MMKLVYLLFSFSLLIACAKNKNNKTSSNSDWSGKKADLSLKDSLNEGKTYLSIYSQIYSISEHKTHNLTAMVSIRNTSETDTIYLTSAKYFNTKGSFVKSYTESAIYITPLETIEIIIEERETEGGTGPNFIFDWKAKKSTSEPLFEGIMNSTVGQQGLSFITQGKRIK